MRKLLHSFSQAFRNIRSNLFHTFLSVLGIVIGVAALVSILSLIDGMEKFAREQIASTTSLNGMVIQSEPYEVINDVRLRKDSIAVMDYDKFINLTSRISSSAKTYIRWSASEEIFLDSTRMGVLIIATGPSLEPTIRVQEGHEFNSADLNEKSAVALVNQSFINASRLKSHEVINREIKSGGKTFKVKGIVSGAGSPKVYIPITHISYEQFQANTPDVILEANKTEDIAFLKNEITQWLKENFKPGSDDFNIITNDFRIEQATQGFLLFRIIMGLIVGISVIVGGIGVMNVLLISVNERTAEIGIRKATGANRRDIILLFLSESITVSAFGCALGLLFGVLGTMAVVPIIKAITKVPFQAAFTLNTLLVISIVSLLVGVIFGTYPAIRASRLDPVDAIRHE